VSLIGLKAYVLLVLFLMNCLIMAFCINTSVENHLVPSVINKFLILHIFIKN
jgi:hypothetical protein